MIDQNILKSVLEPLKSKFHLIDTTNLFDAGNISQDNDIFPLNDTFF